MLRIRWVDPWGHHVHGKVRFKNNSSYDPKKGFSISQDYRDQQGWSYQDMTNYQHSAFTDLAKRGRPNTLAEHTKIAVDALKAGGATTKLARVSRQKVDEGTEYMDVYGGWHKELTLKPFYKDVRANPTYNLDAVRDTHIPY